MLTNAEDLDPTLAQNELLLDDSHAHATINT
jgi:hypothetical protein